MSARRVLALASLALAGCTLVFANNLDDAQNGGGAPAPAPGADSGPDSALAQDASEGGANEDRADATDVYSAAVLADTPAAYWRLEEASGTTFRNEMGGPSLVISDPKDLVYGVPGAAGSHAIRLTGGHTFEVSGVLSTATNADFAIEAWAKREFTDTRYGIVFEKSAIIEGQRDGMVLWVNPGREIDSAFEVWSNKITTEAALGGPVPMDRFTHFVFTRQGGKGLFYVDGVNSGETSANTVVPDSSPVIAWGDAFTGVLDELAVYTHALSADRVAAHHAAGR